MKRKIVILRFGSHAPTKSDVIAFVKNLGIEPDSGELLGCPIPLGLASIIHTDKSVAEVIQALKDADLPSVVFEESSSVGINLDSMGFEVFADMVKAYEKEFGESPKGVNCTLSLDELLDRVNQVGVDGLSEEEFNRLKELSK
jgi:hypothetical protein